MTAPASTAPIRRRSPTRCSTPDLDVYDTFRTVRGDVRQATGNSQIPWITGSIETRFVFRPKGGGHAGQMRPPTQVQVSPSTRCFGHLSRTARTRSDFERFVKVFPNSRSRRRGDGEGQDARSQPSTERGLYVNGTLVSTSISADAPVEATGERTSEEFVFQQAGERAVSETFRVWPSILPDTQARHEDAGHRLRSLCRRS